MSSDTTLDWDNTRVRCDLSGAGTIKVDYGTQLVIEGDAVVDLSNGGPNGAIQCDGLLHVKDNVRLSNANINVTRASFEGDVNILNNVINAEAGRLMDNSLSKTRCRSPVMRFMPTETGLWTWMLRCLTD